MARITLTFVFSAVLSVYVLGQDTASKGDSTLSFNIGLYLDVFYGYDFNQPSQSIRLPYLYHHNRHNEFNLNHGIISIGLNNQRIRARLGLHAGTYVSDNYTNESTVMQNIYDANVGVSLDKRKRWWIDLGIFGSSWIGMESTLSFENYNLSHNLISENVPYYYSGINTSFQPNEKWQISAIITNGWQRIRRVEGNSLPSFGTQVTYSSNTGNSFNWSSFTGTDDPDSARRIRIVNHLNTYIHAGRNFIIAAGFDIGFQQASVSSDHWDHWYGLAAILRYHLNHQNALSFRYEYYHDPQQLIVTSLNSLAGYKTSGFTLNYDHGLFGILLLRVEGRWLTSPDSIYPESGQSLVHDNFFLLGSIALNWNKVL